MQPSINMHSPPTHVARGLNSDALLATSDRTSRGVMVVLPWAYLTQRLSNSCGGWWFGGLVASVGWRFGGWCVGGCRLGGVLGR